MLASVPIAHLQCRSQIRFTCICSFFSQIHDFPLRTATPSVCHHWCPVMSPRDPGISLDPSFYFSSYIPLFISFFFFSSLCSFLKKKKNRVPTKDFALCLLLDIVWRMNQSLEFILKLKGHPQYIVSSCDTCAEEKNLLWEREEWDGYGASPLGIRAQEGLSEEATLELRSKGSEGAR